MKKIISKVSTVLLTVVVIWFAWSFIDINNNNDPTDENCGNFSKGNAIVMVSELFN